MENNQSRGNSGYTLRWTDPKGKSGYPANPTPLTLESAIAGKSSGSVYGWTAVVVRWEDYLKALEPKERS